MVWKWDNYDKTDVVSMTRCGGTPLLPPGVSIDSLEGYGSATDFCFTAEKKGYTVVKKVFAKGDPDFERKINISVCVID